METAATNAANAAIALSAAAAAATMSVRTAGNGSLSVCASSAFLARVLRGSRTV